jgi:hypothetical protein
MVGGFFKIFGCRPDCLLLIVPLVKVKKSGRTEYARPVRAAFSGGFAETAASGSAKPLGTALKVLKLLREFIPSHYIVAQPYLLLAK